MKKILITIGLLLISLTMFAQRYDPFFRVAALTTPYGRPLPNNTIVFCNADSTLYMLTSAATALDNIATSDIYVLSGSTSVDTSSIWVKIANYVKLNDTTDSVAIGKAVPIAKLNVLGNSVFEGDVTASKKLLANGYINTDSSYYIKGIEFIKANHNLGNQFIGVGSGANNIVDSINFPPFGYLGSLNTADGYYSLYNNTMGLANIANGAYSLYSNTTGSDNIAIGYNSGYAATLSNRLWIGQGDSNNAIIYGEMLTRPRIRINGALNVKSVITNGGLINRDTVLTLVDDATFKFPTTSVGWADIQCDSVLIEKTWGIVSWNGDGATTLRSSGAKFVNTNIDGNYACFYDGGSYAILRNTSGYTQTYSIKYHYHY